MQNGQNARILKKYDTQLLSENQTKKLNTNCFPLKVIDFFLQKAVKNSFVAKNFSKKIREKVNILATKIYNFYFEQWKFCTLRLQQIIDQYRNVVKWFLLFFIDLFFVICYDDV